jgi:hypothetical protein
MRQAAGVLRYSVSIPALEADECHHRRFGETDSDNFPPPDLQGRLSSPVLFMSDVANRCDHETRAQLSQDFSREAPEWNRSIIFSVIIS